jgi:hypothetical protein
MVWNLGRTAKVRSVLLAMSTVSETGRPPLGRITRVADVWVERTRSCLMRKPLTCGPFWLRWHIRTTKRPGIIQPDPANSPDADVGGHSNDFHTSDGLPKNDEVGEPLEQHPAHAKNVFRELSGVTCNSVHCPVELIQEHFRSSHAAPPVPLDGGFSFFQSCWVDSNRCAAHRSSRNRRRRRASSHGMS